MPFFFFSFVVDWASTVGTVFCLLYVQCVILSLFSPSTLKLSSNVRNRNCFAQSFVQFRDPMNYRVDAVQAVLKLNQRLALFPWLGVGAGDRSTTTHCKLCVAGVPWRNLQQLREHEDSAEHCVRAEVSVPDPGSDFFPSRILIFSIPDPGSISKNFKYLNPKKWFLSFRKYDPGCSSRILIFYPSLISDPGSRGQKGTGSRNPDPDLQHWFRIPGMRRVDPDPGVPCLMPSKEFC